MNTKRIRDLGIGFIIIGIIFIITNVVFGYETIDVYLDRVETTGIVEYIDKKHGMTKIRYDAVGESVTNELYLIDSSYSIGTEVKVYYDKNKPEYSYIKPQFTFLVSYFIMGISFICLGIVFVIKTYLVLKKS